MRKLLIDLYNIFKKLENVLALLNLFLVIAWISGNNNN